MSRRHASNDPNLVPPGVAALAFHFSAGAPISLSLANGSSLENIRDLVNAHSAATSVKVEVRTIGVSDRVLSLEPTNGTTNPHIALRDPNDPTQTSFLSTPLEVKGKLSWPTTTGDTSIQLPTVPSKPDHLTMSALTEESALSIDLPFRVTEFSRGALALQYESLPFYYRHRMLLIAQAAHVVSPITPIEQQDFEYRSMPYPSTPDPDIDPTMKGADAGPEARAIQIPLARLWDSLPEASQNAWPCERPVANELRPGALLDPGVTYSIAIERPGSGNVQVVAEYRFKADEFAGFESRPLPGPFKGVAVRTLSQGNDKHPVLETLLNPSEVAIAELVTEPVVSWRRFAALPGLATWATDPSLYPRNLTLQLASPATGAIKDKLVELMKTVDPSMADAIRQLVRSTEASPVAAATLGLEQLKELHDGVVIDALTKKITWTGTATTAQKDALEVWVGTSLFRGTFQSLLDAFTGPAGPYVVPIKESFWKPRPEKTGDLSPSLQAVLLLGAGVIGHKGVMPHSLAQQLANAPNLTAPEVDAVRRLYLRTLNSGLGGGTLKLLVRRGSAKGTSRAIEAASIR
ncbi:MAG: hypothetical protein IAG10_34230 [Planctomycetaceae bacterium]|nr:hypothetical protein [Planctomycetaceae bacterium]